MKIKERRDSQGGKRKERRRGGRGEGGVGEGGGDGGYGLHTMVGC